MTASEIRARLLREHAELRVLASEARRAAAQMRGGGGETALRDLGWCIHRLGGALRIHNDYEERALREVIKKIDAWGPARAEIMEESHMHEHAELLAALVMTSTADADAAGASLSRALDKLEAHMTREEEVLLAEGILRDDDVVIDYFGG
jgi:hypothetical protein